MCAYECVCPQRSEAFDPLRTKVTGSCELPVSSSGNLLARSNALNHWASSPWDILVTQAQGLEQICIPSFICGSQPLTVKYVCPDERKFSRTHKMRKGPMRLGKKRSFKRWRWGRQKNIWNRRTLEVREYNGKGAGKMENRANETCLENTESYYCISYIRKVIKKLKDMESGPYQK